MADTHHPINHSGFPGGVAKSQPQPVRRQPVPIRPAFRPLLPKPCTQETSVSVPIHIHTRASLANRKRNAQVTLDLQKRRRTTGSGAGAKPSVVSKQASTNDQSRADSAAVAITVSKGASAAKSTKSANSKKAVAVSPRKSSSVSSTSSAEYLSSPISNSSSPDEMPVINSVSTASIFGPISDSQLTPAGLVSPKSLGADLGEDSDRFAFDSYLGDTFVEDAAASAAIDSLYELGSSTTLTITGEIESQLTPPESEKLDSFASFDVVSSADFDEFSEGYFRGFPEDALKKAASETVDINEAGDQDFSIHDFLAPTMEF